MKARGFPLQYALLQKADSEFLSYASFLGNAIGMEFEERSKDASEAMQRAEASLAGMDASERPPDLYVAMVTR